MHYRTTRAQLGQVFRCFPFLLRFKYFSDILRTSGWTPDVRLCAMAVAFLHYQTTHAQFSQVFRCFPFITFHLSFFQICFHSYLAYLISDISRGTCKHKLRLGRPSRLPSVFINFETDPRLCSSSQTFFSCINESESLTSNSARTSVQTSTQASTRTSISIHHSPTLHPYPSLSNNLLPHPTDPAPCYFLQFPPA